MTKRFVETSWTFDYAMRLVNDMTGFTSACSRPFHGSNRGSNPRGDAIKKSPQVSRLGGFLRKKPAFLPNSLNHAQSFLITGNHSKSPLNTKRFVETSWSDSRLSNLLIPAPLQRFPFILYPNPIHVNPPP
jgi:hypothetical protein